MVKAQLIFYWISVGFYALATALFVAGWNFKKEWNTRAVALTAAGFVANTVAIGLRWYQTGHFPYYGAYEVYTSYAWGLVLLFLVVAYYKPALRFLGAFLVPLAFLMIGVGIMSSTEVKEIPRSYFTFWLGVHIAFAKLSYGSALIAAGLGAATLLKHRAVRKGEGKGFLSRLGELPQLDLLTYRFMAFAFFMLMIMIISGAIWAMKAWGRYWGWDPVETWAFISWLVYGLALHLYRTFGWRGNKLAWLAIIALVIVVFAFFGIPYFYDTAHEHIRATE